MLPRGSFCALPAGSAGRYADSMSVVTSFPPIAAAGARVLILGSIPGRRSLLAGQYYAHPANAFWRILGGIGVCAPGAPYAERTRSLRQRGIAVWDVLHCCERPGSLDADIVPASMQANDFATFFGRHRRIAAVLCNGGTAFRAFTRVARDLEEPFASLPRLGLPSTSPAHAARSFAQKLLAWRRALLPYVGQP